MTTRHLLPLCLSLGSLLSAGEIDMKPSHISLFENGYGFVSQQASLDGDKNIRLNSLPIPVSGSFWIAAEKGVDIKRLVSGELDYEIEIPVDLFRLAAANPNTRAIVTYRRGKQPAIHAEGVILPFPQAQEKREGNTIDQITETTNNPLIGSVLLVKVGKQTLMINRSQIIDIAFLDDIKLPTTTQRRPGVELELAAAAKGKKIETTCLSSGITWLPSYSIALAEDGSAQLRAKATISNNLMNMESVALDLVLGSPNLSNLSTIDPMALRDSSPPIIASRAASVQMAPTSFVTSGGNSFKLANYAPPAAALSTGNVYFYPIPSFTAKAGQVVTQPLFQTDLKYKNVYTWNIAAPQLMDTNAEGAPPSIGEIDREIHFNNPLDLPLTAAPVEITEMNRIAATDRISFTPPKTDTIVQVGEAINLTTRKSLKLVGTSKLTLPYDDDAQKESKKKVKRVKTITTQTYLVELQVNNQMAKPAELVVQQQVRGHVLSISDKAQVQSTESFLGSDNPVVNNLRWSLQLGAGSAKTLTYTFQIKSSRIHAEEK